MFSKPKDKKDSGVGEVVKSSDIQPNPVEELTKLLNSWKAKHRPWPTMFPFEENLAAEFWITCQEKEGPREHAEHVIIPKKKWDQEEVYYRWTYPYIDRLKQNLSAFLKEDSTSQSYIMAAIEDNIPYRGDDNKHKYTQFGGLTMFQNIVKETETMREIGVEAYKQKALGIMRKVVREKVL
jgi:hypothetical protein